MFIRDTIIIRINDDTIIKLCSALAVITSQAVGSGKYVGHSLYSSGKVWQGASKDPKSCGV